MAIDLALGLLLLIGAWRGYRRGFAAPMLHLTGLIVGLWFAEPLAHSVMDRAGDRLDFVAEPVRLPVVYFAGALAIYLVIAVTGTGYLHWQRKKASGENKPSRGDRGAGVLFGMVGSLVVFGVVLHLFVRFAPPATLAGEPIRSQFDSSRAVQFVAEHRPIERLLDTSEAQRLGEYVQAIVRLFHSNPPPAQTAANDRPTRGL